ncbi:MAG TPA: hypothetical protein VKR06_20715 [Ktedonosporobacter sp.]|nr:hypothetical protein [Ktedonosporobacter sp.]
MHTIVDTFFYGNFKFMVELDTGSETGSEQLTVWVAEKADIETVPLSHFKIDQLLNALMEPQKTRLNTLLKIQKEACQKSFEDEIENLQNTPAQPTKKGKPKLPGKVERRIREARKHMKKALQQLERKFVRQELVTIERQWFNLEMLWGESRIFGEECFLRDFYFEEANDHNIRNFCRKFALDETYRREVLSRKTQWAKRNALFVRNLPVGPRVVARRKSGLTNNREYSQQARAFFHWIDKHVEEILALPEYQRLKEIDNTFQPEIHCLDLLIRPAVEAFNRIPGVVTRFSCQGVSGKVRFQDRDLLAVSPHEEFAYVSFSALCQLAHDSIIALLHEFPAITTSRSYGTLALRSTGDNLRFREEIVELAQRLLASVDESWKNLPDEPDSMSGKFVERSVALPQGIGEPGGLQPARLEWLCQPAQIEQTLYLIYHLNHWAKAREDLLYVDRQGLYQVKGAIVRQAYAAGTVLPVAYIDGSSIFGRDYSIECASDMATEVFLDRISDVLMDRKFVMEDDEYDQAARRLFALLAGYEAKTLDDVEALKRGQVAATISERLQTLIILARCSRQPIAIEDLAALFIEPIDLLDIHVNQNRGWPHWDELDEGDRRKLDPEGLSLVAFAYNSSTAHYTFHLPFRIAEKFLPGQVVDELRSCPGSSRESGMFYGRTITVAESQEHPLVEILHELVVDVAAICPHQLIRKEAHVQQLSNRHAYWEEDEDWDDTEDWDEEG